MDALFDAAASDYSLLLSCASDLSDDRGGGRGGEPCVGADASPIAADYLPSPPMSPLAVTFSPRSSRASGRTQNAWEGGPATTAPARAHGRGNEAQEAAPSSGKGRRGRQWPFVAAAVALLVAVLALVAAGSSVHGPLRDTSPSSSPTPFRIEITAGKKSPPAHAPPHGPNNTAAAPPPLVAKAIRHIQDVWARLRRPRQRQRAAAAMLADRAVRETLAESGQCGATEWPGQGRSLLATVRRWAVKKCWAKKEGAGCEW